MNGNFECDRIKTLQEERVQIQKKTFTKWANSFLEKVSLQLFFFFFFFFFPPPSLRSRVFNMWPTYLGSFCEIFPKCLLHLKKFLCLKADVFELFALQ